MSKESPFNQRVVATNIRGVAKGVGDGMEIHEVLIKSPMPCIVILVHGVNDVGEAYQNQEEGIIAGLSKRMNRSDMHAHTWNEYKMDYGDGAQQQIGDIGRSPVIPFYWGYKPVDHATYNADQRRYREELAKLKNGAKLPYDAYQEDNPEKQAKLGQLKNAKIKFTNDNFGNALDDFYAKGGGTFANATTSIPDMVGPGASGLAVDIVGFLSLHMNFGDNTHPIYDNPHRIYQFFAAQRLADLIIEIRNQPYTSKDTINIVAHSQGTIITMLANMLVKQAGFDPADCVILNHSPYALENTTGEGAQSGHHQTDYARQQTFKNFCNLMKTNVKYNPDGFHTEEEIEELRGTTSLPSKNRWKEDNLLRRNNFGKVYNYFCPNDAIVSLMNVQGVGWRGVPGKIARELPNLRQRVFCENGPAIGNIPDNNCFEMPPLKKKAFDQDSIQTREYTFSDVVVNGEELPVTFYHKLQGDKDSYKYDIDPKSPDQYISFSAKANTIARTLTEFKSLQETGLNDLPAGRSLSDSELRYLSREYKRNYISGSVVEINQYYKQIMLVHQKSPEELEEEWMKSDPVGYSQHSSIVASKDVPEKAMAYDLAIGQCRAFDYHYGDFWIKLLRRADWRTPDNGFDDARLYYQKGILNEDNTKKFMNYPDNVLPKGEFGVVNEYYNSKTVRPARHNETENTEVSNLQWDMPKPVNV